MGAVGPPALVYSPPHLVVVAPPLHLILQPFVFYAPRLHHDFSDSAFLPSAQQLLESRRTSRMELFFCSATGGEQRLSVSRDLLGLSVEHGWAR